MPYVEVDIDLDEFDTEDILSELSHRFKRMGKKGFNDKQKQELKEMMEEMNETLGMALPAGLVIKTLEDKMKFEHICLVWNCYTYSQMESALPSCY